MSAVTLADLRADYEAAIDRLIFALLAASRWNSEYTLRLTAALEVAKRTPVVFEEVAAVKELRQFVAISSKLESDAKVLAIAERNGLQAALLYKLSDGGMDPRKSGDA